MEARLQNGGRESGVTVSQPAGADVNALLAKFPGPLRLKANKTYLRMVFVVLAVIEFVLVKGALTGEGIKPAGWIILAFFTVALVSAAYAMLARNVFSLVLDGDGFTIRFTYRTRRCAWRDVGDFSTWKNGRISVATYNDPALANSLMSKYRRARYDRDTALPDTYGLGADGLAELMTQWQRRALAGRA
jgi:hypothetical protein